MFKTDHERRTPIIVAAAVTAACLIFFAFAGAWHQPDRRLLDQIHRTLVSYGMGPEISQKICYLTISDRTYAKFNESYLNRKHLDDANRILADLGVEAIVYDLIFSRPGETSGDIALANSIKENGRVYLPSAYALKKKKKPGPPEARREMASMPLFANNARGVGHVSAPSDPDGVYRSFYMFVSNKGELVPTLSLRLYLDTLNKKMTDVNPIWGDRLEIAGLSPRRPISIDENGSVYVSYPEVWEKDFPKMSLHKLIEASKDPSQRGNLIDQFEGRYVFVGDVSTGIADAGATPLESDVPLVAIHAAIFNAFLTDSFYAKWSTISVMIFFTLLASATGFAACFRLNRVLHFTAIPILPGIPILAVVCFKYFSLFPASTVFFFYAALYVCLTVSTQLQAFRNSLLVQKENDLIQKDLDIAQRIQRQMLPNELPARPDLDLAAHNIQAQEVGGDFYDIVETDKNTICILVGDVAGKGIPAALYMSSILSTFRTILYGKEGQEISPAEILLHLNDVVSKSRHKEVSSFATVVFSVIRLDRMEMKMVRCGHEWPLKWSAETSELIELKPSGLMIGVVPSSQMRPGLREETTALSRGDFLYFYSDGITEAADANKDFYGSDKLKDYIKKTTAQTATEAADGLLQSVAEFRGDAPQHDDITLVVMRVP